MPDDSDRLIQLAVENGLVYWLDLRTGKQFIRPAPAESCATTPSLPVKLDENASDLLAAVRAALETVGWQSELNGPTFHIVPVNGSAFRYRILIDVDDTLRTIVVYGVFPIAVPEDRRPAVSELITRLNWVFTLGALEMDFSDGDIRYRTGCDVEGGTLTPGMVLTMLGNVAASVDRYGGALMRVVFGGESPEVVAQSEIDG